MDGGAGEGPGLHDGDLDPGHVQCLADAAEREEARVAAVGHGGQVQLEAPVGARGQRRLYDRFPQPGCRVAVQFAGQVHPRLGPTHRYQADTQPWRGALLHGG
nr:hypothetical protein [Streptomyces typhae]